MITTKYIASCSGGKDSVATLLLAWLHNEPLDEVVYCEVMFSDTVSGEHPLHRNFIYTTLKPWVESSLNIPFTVLRDTDNLTSLFYRKVTRGPNEGKIRGFPVPARCHINRDCKLRPIHKYSKSIEDPVIWYVGIAQDEPKRLARLKENQTSLLDRYGYTEDMALELCKSYGLLSPYYSVSKRNGCWFCHNQSRGGGKTLCFIIPNFSMSL